MPVKQKAKEKSKLPVPHWVCIGWCGLISNEPGHCITAGCRRNRNHYTECNCTNGKHLKLKKMYPPQ